MNTLNMPVIETGYEQSPAALRWKHRQAYGPPGGCALHRVLMPSPSFQFFKSGVMPC